MIRIDYKVDGEHVLTTWILERGDQHSLMGRVVFEKVHWGNFMIYQMNNNDYYFEEKH